MGDAGVPEEMRRDLFGDACPFTKDEQDVLCSRVLKGRVPVSDEHQTLVLRLEWVITLPCRKVLGCDDQPHRALLAGLGVVDGDERTILIEGDAPPRQPPELTDATSRFVQDTDEGTVAGGFTGPEQCFDLLL